MQPQHPESEQLSVQSPAFAGRLPAIETISGFTTLGNDHWTVLGSIREMTALTAWSLA